MSNITVTQLHITELRNYEKLITKKNCFKYTKEDDSYF